MDAAKQELGSLLDDMIRMLAVRRQAPLATIHEQLAEAAQVGPAAVYKWREGHAVPSDAAVAELVETGVSQAGMDRVWAQRVLTLAGHPNAVAILHRLFPVDAPESSPVRHNLPRRPYRTLVGRTHELEQLRQRLAPPAREHLVAIEGLRGIGKSALALEVAWGYLAAYEQLRPGSRFDAIVWTSAKREVLDSRGVVLRPPLAIDGLDDLLRIIELVLAEGERGDEAAHRSRSDLVRSVERLLRGHGRVLLIVDSLDDLEGPAMGEVLAFLQDLPVPHRALVTARFHEDLPDPLSLSGLDLAAMRDYVRQEAKVRGLRLSAGQVDELAKAAGGVAEVAWWYLGLMAREGLTVPEVNAPLAEANEPLARHLFGDDFDIVRKRLPDAFEGALRILFALTLFDERASPSTAAIAHAAALQPDTCRRVLHRLRNLNLVREVRRDRHEDRLSDYVEDEDEEGGEPRFTTIPFVGEYAGEVLGAATRDATRACWVNYYLRLTQELCRGMPARSADYDVVEREWPNLLKVFAWCTTQPGAYERLKEFWLDDLLSVFTDVRGYWDDRRRWLGWLAIAADERGERDTAVLAQVLGAQATLLLERYDEAEAELRQALDRRALAPAAVECELFNTWALLAVRRRDFAAVRVWLDELDQALDRALNHGELPPSVRRHHQIDAAYYQGRVHFLQGAVEQAESEFQRMLQLCEEDEHHLVRERAYAQNALAEVAVKNGQDQFAAQLLQAAYAMAVEMKDRRLLASINRTRAALSRRFGERRKARTLISAAQQEFNRLGMKEEAAQTPECVAVLAGI